jgi:hypothetical protein
MTLASRPQGPRLRDLRAAQCALDTAGRPPYRLATPKPKSPAPSIGAAICRHCRGSRSCRAARPSRVRHSPVSPLLWNMWGAAPMFQAAHGRPRSPFPRCTLDGCALAGGADGVVAGSGTGSATGALAVARSTVTLRTGSGALAAALGAGSGAGPDNSSGTISTTSTPKIDAPTKRCLTRSSIACGSLKLKMREGPQYIRDVPPVAVSTVTPANQVPARPCGRNQRQRFDR